LHLAAQGGHAKVIDILIKYGVDINAMEEVSLIVSHVFV